jgi:hypothetical protein
MYVKNEKTLNINFETDTEKRIVEDFLSKLVYEIEDSRPDDVYEFLMDLTEDLIQSDEDKKDFQIYY